MMSAYEQLLQELGVKLGIPLKPDLHQSCLLNFGKVNIQIDIENDGEDLLLGSFLGKLSPSPFRTEVFKLALRKNDFSKGNEGILAFTRKSDSLVLFRFLPIAELNGEGLYEHLLPFLDHARAWGESLERGEMPIFREMK